ncbi:hypothetical protein IFM89_020247 [Coptis chinensis]|uniref:Thioredoxin-like protein AAED1, chloroplastic n=1 Tax=Coptis chinensis TaxID=261450 RepID=A0A835LNF7_9MAGN|nr:hypothetical protein IFM89_020247 [Coptis chinensis]
MATLPTQTLLFQQPRSLPSFSHFTPLSTLFSSFSSVGVKLKSSFSSVGVKLKKKQSAHLVVRASTTTYESNEAISEILGDVGIFTAAGEPVLFKDLWDQKEGMAVVALLRHFGCPCCWEFASALKDSKSRFDSAGVKLIAVGVGTPNKARMLAERGVSESQAACLYNRLPFPLDCLYCDPDRKAYDVLGLYYGFGRTFFNPASAKVLSRFNTLREAVKNYTIEATPDDRSSVLQQGGMFVFKGKQLLYSRKDEGTGDHAPLSEILDICCTYPA